MHIHLEHFNYFYKMTNELKFSGSTGCFMDYDYILAKFIALNLKSDANFGKILMSYLKERINLQSNTIFIR